MLLFVRQQACCLIYIILGLLAHAYGFLSSPPADSVAAVGSKMFFAAQAGLIALLTRRLHTVGDKTQVSVGVFRGILVNAELGLERDSMRPPTLSWDSWVAQWRRPFQAAAARSMISPVGN